MNHTSSLDIPIGEIVSGSFPHIWFSKSSYSRIPILGTILRRMHVLVDTKNRQKALFTMYSLLKENQRHALIFPEGTRYDTGKINSFYPGFAMLAQKLNRPIIPIAIVGMHTIFPKKSFLIDSLSNEVTIIIGKPVVPSSDQSVTELAAAIQENFELLLEKHQGQI